MISRRMEATTLRRSPTRKGAGAPGFHMVLGQHNRGDKWWRAKFADLIETRKQEQT